MLKSKLVRYISIRSLILFIILVVLDFVFLRQKCFIFLGLFFGAVFGIVKFSYLADFLSRLLVNTGKEAAARKCIIVYVLSQIITAFLLIISVKINIALFAGFAGGILLFPATVFIICITGGSGILKKNLDN